MQQKIKTINVDQVWMTGKGNPCKEYVAESKMRRKFINKINNNLRELSIELKGKTIFPDDRYHTENKISYLVDRAEDLPIEDKISIVDKDYTLGEFLNAVYEIRKRNFREYAERRRNRTKVK